MKRAICVAIVLAAAHAQAASELGKPIWEAKGLRTPESVLVHELDGRKVLLVSEIEGDATKADGAGGIALLSLDGKILDQDFIRGLNAPKGMAAHENTLYVSDIDTLVVVDLSTRKITARHKIEGAEFLNDVETDAMGRVYVSDSRTGKIHRLADGRIDTYLEGIEGPNGLYASGNSLYIGAGKKLLRVTNGKVTEVATGFDADIDGVEELADGGFIVSCWAGRVYHVGEDGTVTSLFRSEDPESLNTADIGYDRETNTLYIPTFFGNSVRAYGL